MHFILVFGEVKIIFLSDIAHKIVIKMVLEVIILQLSCYSPLATEQRVFNMDN